MEGYRPETYGDRIADVYDAMMADLPDPADCVDRLAELAGPGPGAGDRHRPGGPALAARGVQVHGIDASEAMVERLRAKPGGEAVAVTLGDFAGVPVEDGYRLVYGGIRLHPGAIRYAWPSELDLMARLAGLRLRERWGGWRREPFDADSRLHVSVYEHAEVAAS
jgi:hypothetical protein